MLRRRLFLTAVILVWLAFLAMMNAMRVNMAHTYMHALERNAIMLPLLTRAVAIPIVRAEGLGAALLWLLALLPLAGLIPIWRARNEAALLELWVYGGSAYALLFVVVVGLVAFGLWLPFALL